VATRRRGSHNSCCAFVALSLRGTHWAALSLRASRWTYGAFVVFGLLYFPASVGFHLTQPNCEWTFGLALAVHSLKNYPHIILFTIFFLVTFVQLRNVPKALMWSIAACIAMGLLIELAEGASRNHHCRMRDLIPDAVGALSGTVMVVIWRKVRALAYPSRHYVDL
jgi:hypothetical protein